jgi:hypothetical protein
MIDQDLGKSIDVFESNAMRAKLEGTVDATAGAGGRSCGRGTALLAAGETLR